jgi:hypothetical protein
MFFWGPSHGPGVTKKLAFSFADLEPDGCLAADRLASATSTFENPGVGGQKVQIRLWVCPCKNKCFFAMDKYSLLTGAF